jgi:serine/threonine-protein kinase
MQNKYKAVILAGLLAVFAFILFNWMMSSFIHAKKEVMIPDLKGKSITDAVTVLSPMNLGLKKEGEENDETVPAGTILRQSPPAGMAVREGKIIRVTVSQGGKVIYVPSLTGQMARTAEIALRSAGLTIGEETSKYSLVGQKDEVISQDPPAGQSVERDSMVNLVISMGPPSSDILLMPNWVGKNSGEAESWAQANAVRLEARPEPDMGVAPGTVLRQEPAPDTDITKSPQAVLYVAGQGGAPALSKTFYYEIPQGGGDRSLRLTLIDDNGEKEIFRGQRAPGSKLELPVNPKGNAKVRIFINGILVEEREVK